MKEIHFSAQPHLVQTTEFSMDLGENELAPTRKGFYPTCWESTRVSALSLGNAGIYPSGSNQRMRWRGRMGPSREKNPDRPLFCTDQCPIQLEIAMDEGWNSMIRDEEHSHFSPHFRLSAIRGATT